MSWAKIEIELLTEKHDVEEVMLHLLGYFTGEDGIPTAEVHFTGFGPSELSTLAKPLDVDALADKIWANWGPGKRIQAIKDMRTASNLGLKEAKDKIDQASMRNPYP